MAGTERRLNTAIIKPSLSMKMLDPHEYMD
jgi:hypothetical protein